MPRAEERNGEQGIRVNRSSNHGTTGSCLHIPNPKIVNCVYVDLCCRFHSYSCSDTQNINFACLEFLKFHPGWKERQMLALNRRIHTNPSRLKFKNATKALILQSNDHLTPKKTIQNQCFQCEVFSLERQHAEVKMYTKLFTSSCQFSFIIRNSLADSSLHFSHVQE